MKKMILIFVLFLSFGFIKSDNTIVLENAWIKTDNLGKNTNLFVTIKNNGNTQEELLSVYCDFSKTAQLIETFKQDEEKGKRQVTKFKIQPKSTLELKPKSFHVKLIELTENLKANDEKTVTFKFKNAGEIKVKAVVKEKNKEKGKGKSKK